MPVPVPVRAWRDGGVGAAYGGDDGVGERVAHLPQGLEGAAWLVQVRPAKHCA
jgi:hypothetical protein